MGTYRTFIDANRGAVRALGAAHRCPVLGGHGLGRLETISSRTDGQELPVPVEPPMA